MEVFREKVVESVAPEPAQIEAKEPTGTIAPIQPEEKPMDDTDTTQSDVNLWEEENKKKYVNEYFDTHNIYNEFEWKMPISKVDKYVKSQIERKELANTTENYKEILQSLESVIESSNLNFQKRLNKIVGYINILEKLYTAKKSKDDFLAQ